MNKLHKHNKLDLYILIPFIIISLIGLLSVCSSSNIVSMYRYSNSYHFILRQSLYFLLSIIILIVIIKMDLSILYKLSTPIFLITTLLLCVVLIPGVGSSENGARSWINLGIINIQPSEFIKVSLVILEAKYLSIYYKERTLKDFILFLSIPVIIFLLIMLQPDFGTGIVILLSSIIVLFISGAKITYFLTLGILGVIVITILILIAPYRLERITAFLDPFSDPLGSGFQIVQAIYAISPSGLFGVGYNNSIQKHFFLPEPQNDFIFAIFVEEWGFIGSFFMLFLYIIIIYRIIVKVKDIDDLFHRFLLISSSVTLFIQIIINIYVVVGLIPVTGITLPFMSYGGSSLIVSFILMGIILKTTSKTK